MPSPNSLKNDSKLLAFIRGRALEELSDFELVTLTKKGRVGAFSVLVTRYQKPLISMCMRYVHDLQLAEDIVQESFLKAYEKIASFEFRSAFKSWLYRIAINTAKNSLRSKRVNVNIDDVQIKVEAVSELDLIERQLIEQVQRIVSVLPDKQQSALRLRVFGDMSFRDVAKKMGCPYDTAKANYRHGLLKLREKLAAS